MDATALFRAGKLSEAIDAQIAEVKAKPGDHAKRLFLFELLSFAGEIDRAQKQIDVLRFDEVELQAATADWRQLLESERARQRFFSDGQLPKFLTDPPEHVRLRLNAAEQLRAGKPAEAGKLLDEAAELTPEVAGTLNGQRFTSFCDCDDLLSGVLEVMGQGSYFWVPLESIDVLAVSAPKFPRDLLWATARLETRVGESGQVFLPTLYPGSFAHADDQIKLGRMTDWHSDPDGPTLGQGLKTFLAGEESTTILDWRELLFDASDDALAADEADEVET